MSDLEMEPIRSGVPTIYLFGLITYTLSFPLSIDLLLFHIRASSNNTMNILDRVSYKKCLPFIIEAFTGAMGLAMIYVMTSKILTKLAVL